MLASLHIENIAVIKCCDIDFSGGFCVLTGETGAGKSILIDSISLLLGARFSRDLIRSGEETATVAGMFTDLHDGMKKILAEYGFTDEELYLQRSVTIDGKSVTKCNGRTIPVAMQKKMLQNLLAIHGQHDNETFLDEETHIRYLDDYAKLSDVFEEYRNAYEKLREIRDRIESVDKDEKEKARLCEMYTYQIRDIESVKPKAGEEERLEAEKKRIRNFEKINKNANLVYHALYRNEKGLSAYDMIKRAAAAILQLDGIMEGSAEYAARLEEICCELADTAETVHDFSQDDGERAEEKLDRIETRLDQISKLKRKYGADIAEVLQYCENCKEQLRSIERSGELLEEYKNAYKKQYQVVTGLAENLRKRRKEAGVRLSEELEREFSYLDMPKMRFSVLVEPLQEPAADGMDCVRFLIASNPGEPFKPLSKIASGGELSRITLAAKCVLIDRVPGASLVFDEVDTGVSGRTSHKVGTKLRALAHSQNAQQVFCVTHSAQVAALADTHYLITKEESEGRVYTGVKKLDDNGRIGELARILGGMEVTEATRNGAEDLLRQAKDFNIQITN